MSKGYRKQHGFWFQRPAGIYNIAASAADKRTNNKVWQCRVLWFTQVGADVTDFAPLLQANIKVPKSGYVYIWVSNDSEVPVYFDDLAINHRAGPLLQEDDYYPFGLEMKMLGSRAAGKVENKLKYNGKELQSDFDLEWTDYGARMYDQQIGRWHVVDPMSDISRRWSPYSYAADNPIRFIDVDGMYFDDYQLNQNGSVELIQETDDDHDVLFATSKSGEVDESKSIDVKKGILGNIKYDGANGEGTVVGFSYMTINSDEALSDRLFEFMASNSQVEIAITKLYNGTNYISTSNEAKGNAGPTGTMQVNNLKPLDVSEETHSHPGGVKEPSGARTIGSNDPLSADVLRAFSLQEFNKNMNFCIYTASDRSYSEYSGKTTRPVLEGATIKGKRRTFIGPIMPKSWPIKN